MPTNQENYDRAYRILRSPLSAKIPLDERLWAASFVLPCYGDGENARQLAMAEAQKVMVDALIDIRNKLSYVKKGA